jgi:hypothetical protein
MTGTRPISLCRIPGLLNADGEPMPLLLVPRGPGMRDVLLTFATMADALEEKRRREGAHEWD